MMELIIRSDGNGHCIYSEEVSLAALGGLRISRASMVEPTPERLWFADLLPVGGPVLGPFAERTSALAAEIAWLREHWLLPKH